MKRLILLVLLAAVALCVHEPFGVIFEWKSIDFNWPSDEERQYALARGDYIQENNIIATAKFWKGKMYCAMPRMKNGTPMSLGVTSAKPVNGVTAPKLSAFPNWSMQKLGDCSAFQFVQSMEIDPKGRMWVIDTGRENPLQSQESSCSPRLCILDLENHGKILRTYTFPEHVAHRNTNYLNDIVLDHEDGVMAYIADCDSKDPGIIVYSLKRNTSWKIRHDSMKPQSEAISFMVAKTHMITPVGVDGIALSPASASNRQVYYAPLSSFHLYSIPTSTLKRDNATNVDSDVKELGRKSSQTDGMIMSAKNVLYFGLLADDAIAMWDIKNSSSFTTGQRVMSRDHVLTQWPDSFAFDEDGNLWCVIDMLHNFLNNRVNVSSTNCRFIRTRVYAKNYQYYENGTAPELPDITAGANSVSFALATLLSVLLVLIMK